MLSDYEDSDGEHQYVQQSGDQSEKEEGSSESDNSYKSSEPEREKWQDDIDPEQDWDVKVVGVEVAKGDELHYEARWPSWSRSDGTTNTYHRKGDPSSPLKGLTRDWDDAREEKISSILRKLKDHTTADTALGIEVWADNNVMSSNTRYNAQLFNEKLAILEGRVKRKKGSPSVQYDLGEGLETEMLRLLTKEIGKREARRKVREYSDNEEQDGIDKTDTDEDENDTSPQRRTRSETGSRRTRSTAPSTSSRASTSRALSIVSSVPLRSQLKTLGNIQSTPGIPQAQSFARQVNAGQGIQSLKRFRPKQSSSLIPPGRSTFSPSPQSSFNPHATRRIPPALSPRSSPTISSASSTSTLNSSLASSWFSVAASKEHTTPLSLLSPSLTPDAASTTRERTTLISPSECSTKTLFSQKIASTPLSLNSSNTPFSFYFPSSSKPLSTVSAASSISTSTSVSTASTSTLELSSSLSSLSNYNSPEYSHLNTLSTNKSRQAKNLFHGKAQTRSINSISYSFMDASPGAKSPPTKLKSASTRSSSRIRTMGKTLSIRAKESSYASDLKSRASEVCINLDANHDFDMVKADGNAKRKGRETRSRLQLLSLAWTETAAQTGAAPIAFVNDVDDEDGPPGIGLSSDPSESEFTYLEAETTTYLKELLDPPDPGMFLSCSCGAHSETDVDMDIEMLFEGTESDLDNPEAKGKGKARAKSGSRHVTSEKTCSVTSACGCQGISELVDKKQQPISAYTEDGLFKYASRSNPLASGIEVIECNQYCKCNLYECCNRVAQRPRSVPIEVFKTETEMQSESDEDEDEGRSGSKPRRNSWRGWGVRCTAQEIKRGTVLGCYTGEIVHRQSANQLRGDHGTYVFDLDGRDPAEDNEEIDPNLQMYSIDARRCGNWTRFLNHSCLPNLAVYTAVWDTIPEQNIPHLVFFALEDITKGTEMTVDYHAGNPLPKKGRARANRPPGTGKCFCGAKRCRGWV